MKLENLFYRAKLPCPECKEDSYQMYERYEQDVPVTKIRRETVVK